MAHEHYFSAEPASAERLRRIPVDIAGRSLEVTTASGVFSPAHVDLGTRVLLGSSPAPPPTGDLLDLGCGWGPISIRLALDSPAATVWAVDVNERALDLVRRNAADLGLTNINAVRPEDVPADVSFSAIQSNPPIRVGKSELHTMMLDWLPRLGPHADAWLVVARNLGADSLQTWLEATLDEDFAVSRVASNKGFRTLRVHRAAAMDQPSASSPS